MARYANKIKETVVRGLCLNDSLCVTFYIALTGFFSSVLVLCAAAARLSV